MSDFEVIVPDGYQVVETDEVVKSDEAMVYTHVHKTVADRHAKELNDDRLGPLLRWKVKPVSKEMREHFGWSWFAKWAVVPYQNVLRKVVEEDGESSL